MNWDLAEIIAACSGKMIAGESSPSIRGVSTDTRKINPGDLYVALEGPNFNGHDFIQDAASKGALGAVVSKPTSAPKNFFQIQVPDTLKALGDLAHAWRLKFNLPVIGITGSSGKTSTKEMLSACLAVRGPVSKTEGNLNNLIGLPLTVFGLNENHQTAVWEMGMSLLGEIDRLARIAKPDIGLITNVGHAHLEGLGSIEGVAKAKGELFNVLEKETVAIVNIDDPHIAAMPTKAKKITVGFSPKADIRAEKIDYRDDAMFITVRDPKATTEFRVPFIGEHHARNWLVTYGVLFHLGFSPAEAHEGLSRLKPAKMRGETVQLPNGALLVNDAYNANPDSMEASLKSLAVRYKERRRIAVLGQMLELGPSGAQFHFKVGQAAQEAGISILLACGENAPDFTRGFKEAGGADAKAFSNVADLSIHLKSILKKEDVVLVKGSRGARMEEVIRALSPVA